jgi:hypothetical protein
MWLIDSFTIHSLLNLLPIRFFKKLNAKSPQKPLLPYLPKKMGVKICENPILLKLKEARAAQVCF